MGMLLVQDTTLYFQEVGKGDALLFIHGMCGDANVWDAQSRFLARSFRCVTYDRRGHTRSPLGKRTVPPVTVHADDAAELINGLGLEAVVVVTSDYGAEISLDLIRRYPRIVLGAVLSEPLVRSLDLAGADEFRSELAAALRGELTSRAAVDKLFRAVSDGAWGRLPEARREAARCNHAALLEILTTRSPGLTVADLSEIPVPVLIVSGTRSGVYPRQTSATIAAHMPEADLVSLPDAGRFAYLDRPEQFGEAVRSFARRLTAPTAQSDR